MDLLTISRTLCDETSALSFTAPVTHVYRPLEYAWVCHEMYLNRYGQPPKEVIFLGMNPGPWGMAQTGVPFGDPAMVRDWLRIEAAVGTPQNPHPKVPIHGFGGKRHEVSGQRLWGWIRDRYGTPERFFERFFVANWCPLCFLEASGRNRTPDRLPVAEREPLYSFCDRALLETVRFLKPRHVIGVGTFAGQRVRIALAGLDVSVGYIPHPSPANPLANRGWAAIVESELAALGIH